METQISKAQQIYNQSPIKALQFCKKWRDLGKDKKVIVRGAECISNPEIYTQMGYNVQECIDKAVVALGYHIKVLQK